MMPVNDLKSCPYGRLTETDTRDEVRIDSALFRQLYNDLNVNRLEDVEVFSTSNLVNVCRYADNLRMYSPNAIPRGLFLYPH